MSRVVRAFTTGDTEYIRREVEGGRVKVNGKLDHGNRRLLHIAARYAWRPEQLTSLIELGADVTKLDGRGENVFHVLAREGKIKCTRLALVHAVRSGVAAATRNKRGLTPLDVAMRGARSRKGFSGAYEFEELFEDVPAFNCLVKHLNA